MPGNLTIAVPTEVLPASLCTAFTEARTYEQLQGSYHDGTIQRSQLAQSSRKTFKLSKRLTASAVATLYNFVVDMQGALMPFYFYNPFEVASGQQPGSNYDPTGSNTQGRYVVHFVGNTWSQSSDVCRTNVSGIQLAEVA